MKSIGIFMFLACILALSCLTAQTASAENAPLTPAQAGAVGEAFGKPVSPEEFAYYYKTALLFTRTGEQERDEEETRLEAWQNLIFRHEARELNITITPEKFKEEIERLLSEKGVIYGTENYYKWVKEQFGEDAATLERRIEDLLVINKFMEQKTNPEVTVTDEECKQKFLNQYNSFESEYIRFENEAQAKEFLEKVKKDPRLWKETYDEKKKEGQKGATWINIMSMEALIDLWQIPKDDAYRILGCNEGDFIAAKFFYGDGVFRLLDKKEADMAKYDDKKKEYYKNMLTNGEKRRIVKAYFDDLLKRANYRDYVGEKMAAAKIEELKKKSVVAIETNRGIIELKLFPDIAPRACENFIGLVEKGYYDGIIFHRVIKDFMIQGGDPTGTGTGGESIWGKPFVDEVTEKAVFDKPGILAMANSGPNTNMSQFFITTKPAPHLNMNHTIFGEVVSGLDVVGAIENTPTEKDKPKEEQKIIKAYIKMEKKSNTGGEK